MQFKLIAITALSMVVTMAVASPSLSTRQRGDTTCSDPAPLHLCCHTFDGFNDGGDCAQFSDETPECLQTSVCCAELDGSDATGCILPNSSD
ncbi:hypothetical protein BJ165DRAFT_1532144 [Panaeolus papilionaceus]|nr:hypothetical protein BJ165DRAFT_1532144 [Panaeolus papilionaceus]